MKQKNKKKPSINRVDTTHLGIALRLFGVNLNDDTLDIIIDVVELLEYNGKKTTLMDICELKAERDEFYRKNTRVSGC